MDKIINKKEKRYFVGIRRRYLSKYPFDMDEIDLIIEITTEVRRPFGETFGLRTPVNFSELTANLRKLREIEKDK